MAAGMESSASEPRAPTRVTVAVCGPFDGHGSSINIRRIVYLPDPQQTPRLPTVTPRQFKQFTIQQTMSDQIYYRPYVGESDLPSIMALVQSELSEPYIIYTYRYFLQQWPHLSFLAYPSGSPASGPIGVIVCKQSLHRDSANRGYIAMLSVDKSWRKRGIARTLVKQSIDVMKENGVEEVVLETEFDNSAALSLYESLGFIREKRLYRFYMNGKDAFRLILAVPPLVQRSGSDSASSSYTDSEGVDAMVKARAENARLHVDVWPGLNPYNTRVLPEYIAGYDDSDSDDDVSMR